MTLSTYFVTRKIARQLTNEVIKACVQKDNKGASIIINYIYVFCLNSQKINL